MSSKRSYLLGYLLSILLTSLAFLSLESQWFSGWSLASFLLILAVVQLAVQLFLFLHLGDESRPRWNIYALIFMLTCLLIFVLGSLWIMKNLNYNMMPDHSDEHIIKDEGYQK